MIGSREMGFDDYMKIVRRRLRLILVPALLGAVVGYVITLFLTPEFTSTSSILIEQPTVPQSLVQSVTTEDLFTRLATMQEQILSRTRMQPLIERYDLFKSERKLSMEDAVEAMGKAITITPVQYNNDMVRTSNKTQPVPGFRINFTAENPRLAQQVNSEITSMFMDENLKQHEKMATGTEEFLTNQVADAKRALDEQEAKLSDFKRKNLGALPDDQQANLQVLAALNTQLAAATDQINRTEQDRTYVQSLLSQQESTWAALQNGDQTTTTSVDSLNDQLTKMKASLTVLQGRYTDDYPDVVKLRSNIAEVEKQLHDQKTEKSAATTAAATAKTAQTAANAAAGGTNAAKPATQTASNAAPAADDGGAAPASIQQLRARFKQDEMYLAEKTKEQAQLQERAREYESRVQVSPLVEDQYKQLALGHDSALKFYNDLLTSRNSSQMSVNLESQGEGEQFMVLDSANLPDVPSFPVWWQFTLGGLGIGIVIGVGLAALLEIRDKALRDEKDVEFYLEIPTLALVPSIGTSNGRNGKRNLFRRNRPQAELSSTTVMSLD